MEQADRRHDEVSNIN